MVFKHEYLFLVHYDRNASRNLRCVNRTSDTQIFIRVRASAKWKLSLVFGIPHQQGLNKGRDPFEEFVGICLRYRTGNFLSSHFNQRPIYEEKQSSIIPPPSGEFSIESYLHYLDDSYQSY